MPKCFENSSTAVHTFPGQFESGEITELYAQMEVYESKLIYKRCNLERFSSSFNKLKSEHGFYDT